MFFPLGEDWASIFWYGRLNTVAAYAVPSWRAWLIKTVCGMAGEPCLPFPSSLFISDFTTETMYYPHLLCYNLLCISDKDTVLKKKRRKQLKLFSVKT